MIKCFSHPIIDYRVRITVIFTRYHFSLCCRHNSEELCNLAADSVRKINSTNLKRSNCSKNHDIEELLQEPNTEWNLIYTLSRKVAIETSTCVFQYRILNNILYLNIRLYKMKIVESPLCPLSGNETETILDFFCHCSITQNLWTQMQNWLSNISDVPQLTSKIAILGKYLCQGATDILINPIILMFKNFCILVENRPPKSPLWH